MKELKPSNFNAYTVLMDILYNIWVIVLAFLIGFLGTKTYYGYIYEPTYKSTTTVAVNVRDSRGYITSNITKTIEIAGIFENVFKSDVMERIIAEQVSDFDMANISAAVVPETNLITISAVSTSPTDSYKTLMEMLNNYENVFSENVFEDVYINVLINPTVPTIPNNTVSASKAAFVAGVAFSALLLLLIGLISFMRDTVKQESDIERYVDGQLFGTVRHEKPSKQLVAASKKSKQPIRLNVTSPFCSYEFSEGINRVATKIEYLKNSRSAKTFLFTSVDEHEGKTTISTNVALNLASKKYKTLLIDADLRRPSVYKSFSNDMLTKYNEFGDYLLGKLELKDVLKLDERSGLWLLAGKNSYQFAFELVGSKKFSDMLRRLYEQFDYIIIDSPPMLLTADAENIVDEVDVSILVVMQDKTFIAEINDTIDLLTDTDAYFAGCILNGYRSIRTDLLPESLLSKKYGNYGSYYYGSKE